MATLIQPDPTLLVTERGGPVPPADIVQRMQERVDPALGLRFIPDFDRSKWALTWEWPLSDPRWARVRSGEIPRESAYDIIGYLPLGCSVDQAAGYLETHLKQYPIEEVRRLAAKTRHWNTVELPQQQVQELVAESLEDVARAQRKPNPRRKKVEVAP